MGGGGRARSRFRPGLSAALITVPAVLLLAGCTDGGGRSPSPTVFVAASSSASSFSERAPLLRTPWYRTALPVEGTLRSTDGTTHGQVRIERTDTHGGIVVILRSFRSVDGADLRLHLEPGDVTVAANGAIGIVPDDLSVEIAVLTDEPQQRVAFGSAQTLPTTIHSLSVVDDTSGTLLAAAELVPAG